MRPTGNGEKPERPSSARAERPSAPRADRPSAPRAAAAASASASASAEARRKPTPPEKTHAEEYYFVKQMNAKTPMVVALVDGELLRGWIEWYDEECVKLNRTDAPNLLLYKRHVKYIYKDPDAPAAE